jgi:hypothetical protein
MVAPRKAPVTCAASVLIRRRTSSVRFVGRAVGSTLALLVAEPDHTPGAVDCFDVGGPCRIRVLPPRDYEPCV